MAVCALLIRNKIIFAGEPSLPPYTEHLAGAAQSDHQSQRGYPAHVEQPDLPVQPVPGPQSSAIQLGYPLQTMQPVPVQQTSTVIVQVSFLPVQGMLHINHVRFLLLCTIHH